jgi:3-hydroxyisobutyrate dehydrogenase-like beta-hydroxyacid dehydrogenase
LAPLHQNVRFPGREANRQEEIIVNQKVGFIGLGTMGKPMALNVHGAGFALGVYNRSPEKTELFKKKSIPVFASPRELTQESEAVIIMVTGPADLLGVLQGEEGVLAGLTAGQTIINMSTVSPVAADEAAAMVAAAGGTFIDAPVSGTKKPAEDCTLVILAGGDRELLERYQSLLLTMGKKVVYCGEAGMGTRMKLTINLFLGGMMQCLAEALVLGGKLGLASETIFEALEDGPLAAPFYRLKGQMIRAGSFDKQFSVDLLHKDLSIILEAAGSAGVMLPGTAAVRETTSGAKGMGLGGEDMAAVIKVLAKSAGLEIGG